MIHYLLICAECDPDGQTPMPFETPEAREEWRTVHATVVDPFTGQPHVAFTYYDQRVEPDGRTPHQQYLDTLSSGNAGH